MNREAVKKQNDLRLKVKETDEVIAEVGTEWECQFTASMMKWEGKFTEKQEVIIEKLYKKVCDSPY